MKAAVYLLAVASVVWAEPGADCAMSGFYRELGCAPVGGANGTCPGAFQCPDLHPDPNFCYYKGVPYENRDTIPQSQIDNACSQACVCTAGNPPRFQCAVVDCVETFDNDMDQCISTSELGSCCSTGTVCGKDDLAKLKTCEVDGQIYREGQVFYPQNTRKKCLCTAQWSGEFENVPYCRDYDCGVEIHYQDKIFEKCAPVFISNAQGCPIAFQCPSATTKLVRGINVAGIKGECAFGNLTLSVGDEVTVDVNCITCECKVPPFLTCMKSNCST
nr:Uncharacterized protein [Metisa plana]